MSTSITNNGQRITPEQLAQILGHQQQPEKPTTWGVAIMSNPPCGGGNILTFDDAGEAKAFHLAVTEVFEKVYQGKWKAYMCSVEEPEECHVLSVLKKLTSQKNKL